MSVRLTGYMRVSILNKLLAHKFNPEFTRCNEQEKNLGDAIYRDLFSAAQIEQMNALPKGWLPEKHYIGIQFSDKNYHNVMLPEARRFPYNKQSGCQKSYNARHEFSLTWETLLSTRADIEKRQTEARAAANAILESVTMTGALAAKWPEIVPFLPEESRVVENLPVSFDQVNKLLGLPIAETKEVA